MKVKKVNVFLLKNISSKSFFLKIKVALSPYVNKLYSNCQLHGFFFKT